jgi:GTP-binding protein
LRIEAAFVKSAASAADFPVDGLPEVALVGRSNVGKSSLINALVRRRIARTGAAPGKTRLVNVYRVRRGADGPRYLMDLPGYGYVKSGVRTARKFEELTLAYFERAAGGRDRVTAVLIVDARHPGLENDRAAWAWLREMVEVAAIVATKIDKLGRGERIRALRELESVFEHPVLPVSAVSGEGLDELWKLIDTQASNRKPHRRSPSNSSRRPLQEATAPRHRKN